MIKKNKIKVYLKEQLKEFDLSLPGMRELNSLPPQQLLPKFKLVPLKLPPISTLFSGRIFLPRFIHEGARTPC